MAQFPQKETYKDKEVLIKYKEDKINLETAFGSARSQNFQQKYQLEKIDDIKDENIQLLGSDTKNTQELIKELSTDPQVEFVQPNYLYYPRVLGINDTNADLLWHLDNSAQAINGGIGISDSDIDAPEAWALENAGQDDVIVAVIDSGVAYNHPDLSLNMWDGSSSCKDENNVDIPGGCPYHGWDFDKDIGDTSVDNDPADDHGHGTHIAGIIAAQANNSIGIAGFSRYNNIKIMAVKFGYNYATSVNAVKAINFAKNNGAKVINASWGSYGTSGAMYDVALYNAIRDFPGLFISAAGNANYNHDDGVDAHKSYPDGFKLDTALGVGLTNIIVVAATNNSDTKASFSDYGAQSVDVGAPGQDIYSHEGYHLYKEDFESVVPPSIGVGFTSSGVGATWGTYDFVDPAVKVVYGDLNLPYTANVDSYLTSGTFDLSASGGAYLNFLYRCTLGSSTGDFLGFEVYDTGTTAWTELARYNQSGIEYAYFNITPYLGSDFKFRFHWVTDAGDNNYDGCLIDDIKIVDNSSTNGSYQYMSGTSMAAPMVAGMAAMLYSANPAYTFTDVRDNILTTGDNLLSLLSTTTTGKRINLYSGMRLALGITDPVVPTPTPTSGASPQPSTQDNGNSSFSSSPGMPEPPRCTATKPHSIPNIYKVTRYKNTVTLTFVPVLPPVTSYNIAYGIKEGDERWGVEFEQGYSPGSLQYTIGNLNPKGTYYFKIRAGNGCMPGDWSPWVSTKKAKIKKPVAR